ncbi:hypothetical protein IG195_08975 [Arthrobacter sp. TES]|uniref:hypothetical protein n=1 Tax=Paenarthrobacter ureafaciens TaxID=37931 RepID=UPI0003961CF7|nr:hypothetical protein [Paenarthrobacter ureafaciens]ERI37021.1 hypothetical protein M707_13115 [Arthrobacter sp. AK-YN10]QOI65142.1 hypothetical protein IG195_08975 [Arthrobacter sp. TES]BCW86096.1 hypothetical protein NicSoilE8_37690 [Arthrobacter sp. NicSoilE8]GLU60578.1 hypothetical protein Pure01_30910 [Paenarthrobacter ureafaciens]GLU64693.1 hypothetical protein Pure02_29430 [Paenarthrobacter ureafaciens]
MKSINAMWGGILTRLALDPVIQTCELRVEVVEAEGVSTHDVVCRHIVDCHFYSSIPGPWSYAEVTQVEAAYDHASALWAIEFMLWSEEAGISIKSPEILINGELIPIPAW